MKMTWLRSLLTLSTQDQGKPSGMGPAVMVKSATPITVSKEVTGRLVSVGGTNVAPSRRMSLDAQNAFTLQKLDVRTAVSVEQVQMASHSVVNKGGQIRK